jgi:hypothetical protein
MDRRDAMGLFGLLGVRAAVAGSPLLAAGDGDGKNDAGRFMAPVSDLHAHFCGIHVAKNNPKFQIIAQHYCGPHGDEMHQCLLFDSLEKNAKVREQRVEAFGLDVRQVPQPKSLDEIGRQWTAAGADKPTRRKK